MTKSVSKRTTGNCFEKAKYHIPFYTTAFFNPDGEMEEGEVKNPKVKTVKIPVKIATSGDESRSNVTSFEMKSISHFDNNVENVLETLSQLQERVIKPKAIDNKPEEVKVWMQLMQLICSSGPASQTLQEAAKIGRTHVYEEYIKNNDDDEVEEEVMTSDESAFFEYISREFEELDEEFTNSEQYTEHLFLEFERAFWNHLNLVIFGADAYRAFKQQRDYMLNKIIKPFGVPVEAAFRRVEIVVNLMMHFPPPSSRGTNATSDQWDAFMEIKKISKDIIKEMKYNLLPESYHDRFDELEVDWTEMSSQKFLAEAQKCEAADAKERQKLEKAKEKLKRKKTDDADSTSNLDRAQKQRNKNGKRIKTTSSTNSAGVARLCEFCKLAGAPDFVWKSHNTKDCKKKGDYAKAMSGGAGARKQASREIRSKEQQLKRELKLLREIKKLEGSKRNRKKGNDDKIFLSHPVKRTYITD